jgi:hypothetical protein
MANFILLLAILLGGASFLSSTPYFPGIIGMNWASDVCAAASFVCQNPQQTNYIAVGLVSLWILLKFVSALR